MIPVTFGLLLLEHPQLRGRRRQPLVTRIPLGSEPSRSCQVSPGGWLINRTFPLLNLRRMEVLMGMVAWPPVPWPMRQSAERTFSSSFPSSPARAKLMVDTCLLKVLPVSPVPFLALFLPASPCLLSHAGFFGHYFGLLNHSRARGCDSGSPRC